MTTFNRAVANDIEREIANRLAKEIQEEIDSEVQCNLLEAMGWTIMRGIDLPISEASGWCRLNIRGPFRRFGDNWAFQDAKDAAWFGLKWG